MPRLVQITWHAGQALMQLTPSLTSLQHLVCDIGIAPPAGPLVAPFQASTLFRCQRLLLTDRGDNWTRTCLTTRTTATARRVETKKHLPIIAICHWRLQMYSGECLSKGGCGNFTFIGLNGGGSFRTSKATRPSDDICLLSMGLCAQSHNRTNDEEKHNWRQNA